MNRRSLRLGSLALVILVIIGCRTSAPRVDSAAVATVPISELLTHPRQFKGKRIAVVGYYCSGFELSALYENPEDRTKFVEDWPDVAKPFRGLWISGYVRPGCEHDVHFVEEGRVKAVGTFEVPKLGAGHCNAWPAELTNLEILRAVP